MTGRKAVLRILCPWDSLDRVHRLVREADGQLLTSDYESDPTGAALEIQLLEDKTEDFARRLVDLTNGRASLR